jgi:peptidoglycan/LPS O-acetylase OafA/YrhL
MQSRSTEFRIPSLDGLRALAISFVILSHLIKGLHFVGGLGVSVFFVISGFLITALLCRERQSRGEVSLRDFYLRRVFRILPPFYVYLAFAYFYCAVGGVPSRPVHWISASLFFFNYLVMYSPPVIAHAWSLCVEEQFYLFWPMAFVRIRPEKVARFVIALILCAPILRVLTYALWPSHREIIGLMGHTRVDSLMFGCLAGLSFGTSRFEKTIETLSRWNLPLLSLVFILGLSPVLEQYWEGKYGATLKFTLEGAAITILLMSVVHRPGTLFGRLLNHRWVTHVGMISYSVYLWQQCFMPMSGGAGFLGDLGHSPWNLLVIAVAAHLSYYCVEKPMIRAGRAFRGWLASIAERSELAGATSSEQ